MSHEDPILRPGSWPDACTPDTFFDLAMRWALARELPGGADPCHGANLWAGANLAQTCGPPGGGSAPRLAA